MSSFSIDLTAGGNDRFAIQILEANIVPRPGRTAQSFSVRVANGDPGMRQGEFAGSFEIASIITPTTIYIPFADTSDHIEFDKVAYVEIFTANLQAGTSFRLGSIRAVPEPGSLVFAAIATSAFAFCRLRPLRH
jgi:hypothetical protein